VENFTIDPILEFLNSIGNSIVAFKTGSIVKVHVHTMTPGKVFDFCQQFGEFLTLKCENMTLQHNDTIAKEVKKADSAADRGEHRKFATVTVATGDGIKETLKTLGADLVIDGGQGKNPSSEDFIEAFDTVNADTIFVLPNNGNIVMAAQLAADIYKDSQVIVIPSKSIGDGYAALSMLSYDSGDSETIASEMKEAMQGVVTGEVTRSVRDANIDGVEIKNNDFIGFSGKNMLSSNADKLEAATEMLTKLEAASHEVMIAIYGNSATTEERKEFRRIAGEKFPRTELYEIDGGQDVYDFEIILE
jgi:dihydroxyacetone kinase-like predicted kinase